MRIQARLSLLQFKSQMQRVPVPRTARTTNEILNEFEKHHGTAEPADPVKLDKTYLSKMFPPLTEELSFKATEGVWYNLKRSRNGRLPVYTDYNNAGHCWTEVRRIQGDVSAFRADLQKALNLDKSAVFIKSAAPTVVVKGNRAAEIREVLKSF